MKALTLLILAMSLSANAKAAETLFDSSDILLIEEKLSRIMTGREVEIELSSGTITCRVNSMAERPGYSCLLGAFKVTSTDVEKIKSRLSQMPTGQGNIFTLESSQELYCANNSMAARPGYYCDRDFNF